METTVTEQTDFMVIGRVRNSENVLRLIKGITEKGFSCYNFFHKPVSPEVANLPWTEQMEFLRVIPISGMIPSTITITQLIWRD